MTTPPKGSGAHPETDQRLNLIEDRLNRIEQQLARMESGAPVSAPLGGTAPDVAPRIESDPASLTKMDLLRKIGTNAANGIIPSLPVTDPADSAPDPSSVAPSVPFPGDESRPIETKPSPRPAAASPHASPPPRPRSAPKPQPPAWIPQFLERIHCWPPPRKGTLETAMASWWLTRVGALLAVIGAVFFAIYVSQNTAAWVRWLELAAVAAGVTALGFRLDRTQPRFGGIVLGAGLSLIYFSAFAAYALPGVKILHAALPAAIWQYAAMLLVLGVGWRRNSQLITASAIFYGYISALFSAVMGLDNFALVGAIALALTALAFDIGRRGWHGALLAVPLAYLIYAVVALVRWPLAGITAPPLWVLLGILMLLMGIFIAGDALARERGIEWPHPLRRIWLTGNTAVAILLGYIATRLHYPTALETYYFGFAAALAIPAAWFWVARPEAYRMQNYFLKATALVTVGLMAHFGARTQWLALAVEGWVLLGAVWQSRRGLIEAAMVVVWGLSLVCFFYSLDRDGQFLQPAAALSLPTLQAAIYLALAAGWVAAQARLLAPASPMNATADRPAPVQRSTRNAVFGVVLGCTAVVAMLTHLPGAAWPIGGSALVLALAGLALASRCQPLMLAAMIVFVATHMGIWLRPPAELATPLFVLAHLTPVAVGWGASLGLSALLRRRPETFAHDRFIASAAVHAIWVSTLLWTLAQCFAAEVVALGALATAWAMLAIGRRRETLAWADMAVWPLILAWLGWSGLLAVADYHAIDLTFAGSPVWWVLLMTGAMGWAVAAYAWKPLAGRFEWLQRDRQYNWLHLSVAMLWWTTGVYELAALASNAEGTFVTIALALSALLLLGVAYRPGVPAARWLPLGWFGLIWLVTVSGSTAAMREPLRLGGVMFAAGCMVAWPLAMQWLRLLPRRQIMGLAWGCGLSGLALADLMLLAQDGILRTYLTAGWGMVAIAVFLAGFAGHLRPLRMTGLLGLALCIPRILLVDVQSSFARIVVFVLLGIGMLAMGFLYQRFQGWLTARDQEAQSHEP